MKCSSTLQKNAARMMSTTLTKLLRAARKGTAMMPPPMLWPMMMLVASHTESRASLSMMGFINIFLRFSERPGPAARRAAHD